MRHSSHRASNLTGEVVIVEGLYKQSGWLINQSRSEVMALE